MRKLYLTRHGQTLFNEKGLMQGWSDSPLSELGVRQTLAAKEFIEENNLAFDRVISSPLTRCLKTTRMLVDDQRFEINEHLREWNFGYFEGEPSTAVHKDVRWRQVVKGEVPNFFKENGGEGYQEFIDRFMVGMDEIINSKDESILVVTHGAVIRLFFNLFNDEKVLEGEFFLNNCILEYNILDDNSVEFVSISNPAKRVE